MQKIISELKDKMTGKCVVCLRECIYNVCPGCEGLRDAMYVFHAALPKYLKLMILEKQDLPDYCKEQERVRLLKDIEPIKHVARTRLLPLTCYAQEERKQYVDNYNAFSKVLDENTGFRNKLFFYDESKDKFDFKPGHYYDVIKYNYDLISAYIQGRNLPLPKKKEDNEDIKAIQIEF